MIRTLKLLLLLASMTTVAAAQGQSPQPVQELSLTQAIQTALENNFQIKIARNNVEIARNENDLGNAGAYPDVNVGINLNNGYTKLNQPASFLQQLSTGTSGLVPSADVSWVLYNGGRIKLTKAQFEELERRSEGQARLVVENTVQDVILSYYQVLLRREQIAVLEEVLRLSRDRIALEETKRDFGQASTFDILQTRDAYLNDSTNYILQQTGFQNAIHNLNLAMGIAETGRRYVLTDSLVFGEKVYDIAALRNQLLTNNNQLNTLYSDRELSLLNTRLLETARKPSIGVNAGAAYNFNQNLLGTGTFANGDERDLGGIRNQSLNGFINFGISYNLYNGGAREIGIQSARIRELNTQLIIDDVKLGLTTQLENTYATFTNQQQLLQVTADLLENARRNLSIAEDRYRGGLINSFDYRVIQLNYINASQARIQAIFNLKQTETELRRLVGDLVR